MNKYSNIFALFLFIISSLLYGDAFAKPIFDDRFYHLTLEEVQRNLNQQRAWYTVSFNNNLAVVSVEKCRSNPFQKDSLLSKFQSHRFDFENNKIIGFYATHNSQDETFYKLLLDEMTKVYGSPKITGNNYQFEDKTSLLTIEVMNMREIAKHSVAQMKKTFKSPDLEKYEIKIQESYGVVFSYKIKFGYPANPLSYWKPGDPPS